MAPANKSFVFSAAIRGFHVYRDVWGQEKLTCLFEENNVFDMFAIKTLQADGGVQTTVGHLPREISRPTKFLLDRGANVEAELTATHYRRSPLFQGGLEIPCIVKITMPASVLGHLLLKRYEELVLKLYCEPKEEIIMGSFIEKIPVVITDPNQHKEIQRNKKKKKRKATDETKIPTSKDIRSFFNKNGGPAKKKHATNKNNPVIID